MIRDFAGQTVLITGGTSGIGLATGLTFARRGAHCVLTYRWGNADEAAVQRRFIEVGGPPPMIVQADASDSRDTEALMSALRETTGSIDTFVNNVTGATLVTNIDDLSERALLKTMRYSVWPVAAYIRAIRKTFNAYPRYVVALSSSGPDRFNVNYDFVATSKAALETLCRYLAHRLRRDKVHVNVVRTLGIRTASFRDAFGDEFTEFVDRLAPEHMRVNEEEVADVILAICSGLLDGVNGQVITVDKGSIFADNIMRLYAEREVLGL